MVTSVRIGITGVPHVGKTQALLKIIRLLEEDDIVVGGMITESIIKGGDRVGFYVMDWMTKEKAVMAHKDIDSKIRVSSYGVDIEALESVGVKAIEKATDEADVIVIDEVGKMEVESKRFVSAVNRALETTKPIILTLHKKSRNPLLQDIRRRNDVRLLEVTQINRDFLPFKVVRLLKGEIV